MDAPGVFRRIFLRCRGLYLSSLLCSDILQDGPMEPIRKALPPFFLGRDPSPRREFFALLSPADRRSFPVLRQAGAYGHFPPF